MTDVDAEIDKLIRDLYMDGWHATAPDYDGEDVQKVKGRLLQLIARERLDELGRFMAHTTPTRAQDDYYDERIAKLKVLQSKGDES